MVMVLNTKGTYLTLASRNTQLIIMVSFVYFNK